MEVVLLDCVFYYKDFLSQEEAQTLLVELKTSICWKHESIKLFGKEVMQPRLTAWYGDLDKSYRYSGREMKPHAWTDQLLLLKTKIEQALKNEVQFTSVLLNFYRDGRDSMGWHRDNEKELGLQPIIASVSLGSERRFLFREYENKKNKRELLLQNGSLLVMRGDSQLIYEHSLPKAKNISSERINLTFRKLM